MAHPNDKHPRFDFLEELAREKENMPPTWRVYRWECFPKNGTRTIYLQVSGAVCVVKFSKGKRAGHTNWRMRDKTTERITHVLPAELDAYKAKWEAETGRCMDCFGNGQEWNGWSAAEGTIYRDCRRCKTTGAAPREVAP